MTDEQKYHELLKEIGEIIKGKNDRIFVLEYEVKTLTEQLEKAEKELETERNKNNE